jgi:hypothetical protein
MFYASEQSQRLHYGRAFEDDRVDVIAVIRIIKEVMGNQIVHFENGEEL